MSRSKIFNMIKNRGTQENGRNTFDLSGFESYSEKCQTINIIRCIDTIPKDYFDIKISDFTQCAGPMKTASFVRGSREIAAYYIPYNSIWHNFNQYQATREDPDSTLLQQKGIAAEPRFSLFGMYIQVAGIFGEWLNWRYLEFAGQVLLNYSASFDADLVYRSLTDPSDAIYRLAMRASKDTRYDDYKQMLFTRLVDPTNLATNANLIIYPAFYNAVVDGGTNYTTSELFSCDVVGNPAWADCCRKLDMLGYGNIYPVFDLALRSFFNEDSSYSWAWFLNQIQQAADYASALDLLGNLSDGLMHIFRNITFQIKHIVHSGSTAISAWNDKFDDQYVNVYPMYAYNRCFYDMFRNSYYDLDYDVRNYNCDFVNCQTVPYSVIYPIHTLPRFWKLETHQYKKDMFTGVLPDTQFGAVSSVNISNVNINSDASFDGTRVGVGLNTNSSLSLTTRSQFLLNLEGSTRYGQDANSANALSTTWSIPSAFDVFALRRAECLQQYRMDLLRAGNKTRDIFKQIYGSNPKSELDEAPYFIDVYGQNLNIDPIIATANTEQGDNGSLGDIAARITSRGDGRFKFSTEDFGVILILDYTLIDASYNSLMLDSERLALSQESHFIPQLQNLGFEAVFGLQLNMYKSGAIKRRTIGYAPPYLSKKTYIDKVHGNMCSVIVPSLTTEGTVVNPLAGNALININYVGSRAIWTVTRKDMQEAATVQLRHFYGNPNILDDVMVLQYDPTFETDQFICHTFVEVNSVRQLSELGLPRFC